jgi:DNA-binding PadR family transcriptional regulator
LILGVLAGGNLHGYDLHQYLQKNLSLIRILDRSQTYALLSRMEQAGLGERNGEKGTANKNQRDN